jgi:hypothetical protein
LDEADALAVAEDDRIPICHVVNAVEGRGSERT